MTNGLDILKNIDTEEISDDVDIDLHELEAYAQTNYKNLLYHLLDRSSPEFQLVKYELTPTLMEFFDNLVEKTPEERGYDEFALYTLYMVFVEENPLYSKHKDVQTLLQEACKTDIVANELFGHLLVTPDHLLVKNIESKSSLLSFYQEKAEVSMYLLGEYTSNLFVLLQQLENSPGEMDGLVQSHIEQISELYTMMQVVASGYIDINNINEDSSLEEYFSKIENTFAGLTQITLSFEKNLRAYANNLLAKTPLYTQGEEWFGINVVETQGKESTTSYKILASNSGYQTSLNLSKAFAQATALQYSPEFGTQAAAVFSRVKYDYLQHRYEQRTWSDMVTSKELQRESFYDILSNQEIFDEQHMNTRQPILGFGEEYTFQTTNFGPCTMRTTTFDCSQQKKRVTQRFRKKDEKGAYHDVASLEEATLARSTIDAGIGKERYYCMSINGKTGFYQKIYITKSDDADLPVGSFLLVNMGTDTNDSSGLLKSEGDLSCVPPTPLNTNLFFEDELKSAGIDMAKIDDGAQEEKVTSVDGTPLEGIPLGSFVQQSILDIIANESITTEMLINYTTAPVDQEGGIVDMIEDRIHNYIKEKGYEEARTALTTEERDFTFFMMRKSLSSLVEKKSAGLLYYSEVIDQINTEEGKLEAKRNLIIAQLQGAIVTYNSEGKKNAQEARERDGIVAAEWNDIRIESYAEEITQIADDIARGNSYNLSPAYKRLGEAFGTVTSGLVPSGEFDDEGKPIVVQAYSSSVLDGICGDVFNYAQDPNLDSYIEEQTQQTTEKLTYEAKEMFCDALLSGTLEGFSQEVTGYATTAEKPWSAQFWKDLYDGGSYRPGSLASMFPELGLYCDIVGTGAMNPSDQTIATSAEIAKELAIQIALTAICGGIGAVGARLLLTQGAKILFSCAAASRSYKGVATANRIYKYYKYFGVAKSSNRAFQFIGSTTELGVNSALFHVSSGLLAGVRDPQHFKQHLDETFKISGFLHSFVTLGVLKKFHVAKEGISGLTATSNFGQKLIEGVAFPLEALTLMGSNHLFAEFHCAIDPSLVEKYEANKQGFTEEFLHSMAFIAGLRMAHRPTHGLSAKKQKELFRDFATNKSKPDIEHIEITNFKPLKFRIKSRDGNLISREIGPESDYLPPEFAAEARKQVPVEVPVITSAVAGVLSNVNDTQSAKKALKTLKQYPEILDYYLKTGEISEGNPLFALREFIRSSSDAVKTELGLQIVADFFPGFKGNKKVMKEVQESAHNEQNMYQKIKILLEAEQQGKIPKGLALLWLRLNICGREYRIRPAIKSFSYRKNGVTETFGLNTCHEQNRPDNLRRDMEDIRIHDEKYSIDIDRKMTDEQIEKYQRDIDRDRDGQKDLRDILEDYEITDFQGMQQALVDSVRMLTVDELESAMASNASEFGNRLRGQKRALFGDDPEQGSKSRTTMTQLFCSKMQQSTGDKEFTRSTEADNTNISNLTRSDVKYIVITDDASYSGEQILTSIKTIADGYNLARQDMPPIIINIGFASDALLQTLGTGKYKELIDSGKLILPNGLITNPSRKIRNVSSILNEKGYSITEYNNILKQIQGSGYTQPGRYGPAAVCPGLEATQTTTYCERKIPNNKSLINPVRNLLSPFTPVYKR